MSTMPPRPPSAFLALASIAARVRGLSAPVAWGVVASLMTATAALDVGFGDRVSVFILYLAVVGVASWRFAERAGLAMVGAVTLLSVVADLMRGSSLIGFPLTPARRAMLCGEAVHLTAALVLVLVVVGVRRTLEFERWRATVDPLTGLLNRAAFAERLTRALRIGRGGGGLFLLACVDLDGFKALNDSHGHAAGDALLRAFAEGAGAAVAGTGVVARTGGDEFALLAAVPHGEDGEAFARRLHDGLSAVLVSADRGVTCSVGALLVPSRGPCDDAALIAASDALMYEAKRAGKNAVRVAFLPAPLADAAPLPRPRLRLVVSDAA